LASAIGVLIAGGVYLLLRARTFPVILGLTLVSYAVNLYLFSAGRLRLDAPPLSLKGVTEFTDPLPQALILTAIVIGFAMTAFIVALAIKAKLELGSDHVDGDK